jgi:hypothetical protein
MKATLMNSRNQKGSTSLIELLAVISLMSIVVPLIASIIMETDNRLNPMGRSGIRIRAFQTADVILQAIRRDLDTTDRILDRYGDFDIRKGDLILAQSSRTIVYHVAFHTLTRTAWIPQSHPEISDLQPSDPAAGASGETVPGNAVSSQILSRHISEFDQQVHETTLDISISVDNPYPGTHPAILRTTFQL